MGPGEARVEIRPVGSFQVEVMGTNMSFDFSYSRRLNPCLYAFRHFKFPFTRVLCIKYFESCDKKCS